MLKESVAKTSTREKTFDNETLISPRQRYLSLDVLRGATIALMIVVNTPGSWSYIYSPFQHASWHGFTITDLVFPSFLFVIGNAMSFSMRKYETQPDSVFFRKVIKRTLIIFLIGLFLNAFPFFYREAGEIVLIDFQNIRIMGVLQRIAVCYFLAALIIKYFKNQGAIISISALILLLYWAISFSLGDPSAPYSLEGNAALKIDLLVFSPDNIYHGYGIPFEPEGLLSSLPAVVNVLIGYLIGLFIQKHGNTKKTVYILLIMGALFAVSGLIWDLVFPINKSLWTSSYVLYSTGLILPTLAVLMAIIEIAGQKKWAYFFEAFGKNPLFIYILAWIVISAMSFIQINETNLKDLVYNHLFLSWLDNKTASLLFAIWYMTMMWFIVYWMDKKKIYIKV